MLADILRSLDRAAERAIYLQVADAIGGAIRRGELPAGQRLAPVRQVANQLDVNFNTIARAYRRLAEEGLVRSRQGQGTTVLGLERDTDQAAALEAITAAFLQRAYRQGFGPQEVRLELAAAIRRWLQQGSPPPAPL
ncbi:MAG: GntR family transcriptional regulator [Anaerolineales bacterium]